MYRTLSALAIVALVALMSGPAWGGQFVSIDVQRAKNGTAVGFLATGEQPGGMAQGNTAATAFREGSAAPVYPVENPQLIVQGGRPCVTFSVTYAPDAASAASLTAANQTRWFQLLRQWGPCPGVQLPFGPQGAAPQVVAAQYWANQGQNPLLRPGPRIRPGYAVTGKTAYLETGGTTAQLFTDPTGAGNLQIHANGLFYVNWGDGSPLQGPYATTGAPYPDGTITHTWTQHGSYTVTVYEFWTARWSLGGRSGTLSGLRTVGQIAGFPVKELVSVRNR